MLAGVHDPRTGGDVEAERLDRVRGFPGGERPLAVGPIALVAAGVATGPAPAAGCVLEGSVYNLAELAADLEADLALGPESLLTAAFERWGEGMLDRLRGGFALVAWADSGRRILIAVDQVGICSIFLHEVGDRISFASEVRDLLPLLRRTPDPDETAVLRLLATEGLDGRRTAFAGIRRLGAGRRLTIAQGRVDERRYWHPSFVTPHQDSRSTAAARLRDGLIRATALRAHPGDRVGITLSGGLDSAAVAAAASTDGVPSLRGYSAICEDSGTDDERLLDALQGALPITNLRYRVEPGGALALGLEYLQRWKLPLSGPGWVTEYPLLRRASADGVGIMLDGQGGDELYGVAPFLVADRLRAGRLVSAISLIKRFPGADGGVGWRSVVRVLRRYGVNAALPTPVYSLLRQLNGPQRHAPPFLTDRAARALTEAGGELDWLPGSDGPRWWRHLRYLLVDQREAAGLGDYIRHRAAWVGIEGRPPLFDVELIETALRTPPELVFDPRFDRPLVREAMAGLLPDAVRLSRQKSNLAPLYYRGLCGPDLPLIREILGADRLEIERWVRGAAVREALSSPPMLGSRGWDRWLSAVWGWLKVECWLRTLSEPSFAARFLAEKRPPKPGSVEL